MALYCIYLRKSRADLDAEARGEGETLARHRITLLELARAKGLPVGTIYEEIVSGDTIAGRPEMQRLLHDMEERRWAGVICMDIDRLGRGDSSDQGRILKTLKCAGAIIVTLYKTFDPSEEMDEEFFEYGQYMARSEYRRIKRRMWAGRCACAREGKYQSPKPPFGYERIRLQGEKGWTLMPIPAQADAVRLAFSLYALGEHGRPVSMGYIAESLNVMGFTTHGGRPFLPSTVGGMLRNPVYQGKIRWCQRQSSSRMENGREIVRRIPSTSVQVYEGRHPALIEDALWQAVQERLAAHTPHIRCDQALSNPLAGLLICAQCGYSMVRTPVYHRSVPAGAVRCRTPHCPTSGMDIPIVEDALLEVLRTWLAFDCPTDIPNTPENALREATHDTLLRQRAQLERQQGYLHELLESGVYDAATFRSRSAVLQEKLERIIRLLDQSDACDPALQIHEAALPARIHHVLDAYPLARTGQERNQLLRTVIHKIVYHKTRKRKRNEKDADCLTLDVFPLC